MEQDVKILLLLYYIVIQILASHCYFVVVFTFTFHRVNQNNDNRTILWPYYI